MQRPLEGLNGFATGASIIFKATVTDRAANAKDWAESSNQLEIDVTLPTITSATSTSNAGLYKIDSNINVTLGFSENVKLYNDELSVGLNTGHTFTIATNGIDNVNTKSNTYQVQAGEATPDITGASADKLKVLNVSVGAGQLRDSNGNPMALPVTRIPTIIADSKEISVDGIAPDQLKTSFVNTSGGVVRKGYFNNVNENVLVDVPLTKTDATLLGGAIKIKARLKSNGAANNWATVSTDWDVITNAELTAGTKKLTEKLIEVDIDAGKLVLSPTRTYAPVIKKIIRSIGNKNINGIIHCSGGAQTKILHFINDNLHVIKDNMFDIPPLFKLIQKESGVDWQEMYKVFNMGHRMELYVPKEIAEDIISISKSYKVEAKIIGRVEESEIKKLTIISDKGKFFYN